MLKQLRAPNLWVDQIRGWVLGDEIRTRVCLEMSSWTALFLCLLGSLGLWTGECPVDMHCLMNWGLHEYRVSLVQQEQRYST